MNKTPKNNAQNDEVEIVGFCKYCKEEVYNDEDYRCNNGDVEHIECYKLENNFVEELNFDEV